MSDAPQTYTRPARWLHWMIALAVLTTIPMGLTIVFFPKNMFQNQLYDLHRSMGFLILVLATLRLSWRLISPPPPLPASTPGWQRTTSHIVHLALYGCLFAMPLIGWLATSAYPAKISVFGLFTLPQLIAKDRALSGTLFQVHFWLAMAFTAGITLHIAAALAHQFIFRDDLLRRMLPPRRSR